MKREVTAEKNLHFFSYAETNTQKIARLQYTQIKGVNYIEFKETGSTFTTPHTHSEFCNRNGLNSG